MHNSEKKKKRQSFPSFGNVLFVMSQGALATPQGWWQNLSQALVPPFDTVLFLSHSKTWKVHLSINFNGKLNQRICAGGHKRWAKYAVLEIC